MNRISGIRLGRSFLSPTATVQTQEIDFQLGPRMGIEFSWAVGMIAEHTDTNPNTDTGVPNVGQQTLHMETDTLEDIPIQDDEDEYETDTEVFFQQYCTIEYTEDAANGLGTSHVHLSPNSPMVYPPRTMVTVRNVTHRAEAVGTGMTICWALLFGYYYVELTAAELGLSLARRI